MKLHIRLLSVCLVLALFAAIFTKPLAIFVLKRQLEKSFPGSTTTIGNLRLRFWQAALMDIEIKKDPVYELRAKEVRLGIPGVALRDTLIFIDMGKKSISDFPKNIKSSSKGPVFIPGSLEVSNLALDLRSKEFGVKASFSGSISMVSKGGQIKAIDGDFEVLKPGGILTINDEDYLKNMARASGQPVDILLENFKNYRYNTGRIGVSLNKNDIIFEAILDGESGRRDLKLALHDFNIIRR